MSVPAKGLPFCTPSLPSVNWTARFACAPSVLLYPVVHQQVQPRMTEAGSAPSLLAWFAVVEGVKLK